MGARLPPAAGRAMAPVIAGAAGVGASLGAVAAGAAAAGAEVAVGATVGSGTVACGSSLPPHATSPTSAANTAPINSILKILRVISPPGQFSGSRGLRDTDRNQFAPIAIAEILPAPHAGILSNPPTWFNCAWLGVLSVLMMYANLKLMAGWVTGTNVASIAKWSKAPVCGTGDHGFESRCSPQPKRFILQEIAPVAQWTEHWASDPGVAGSSPARRATGKKNRRHRVRRRRFCVGAGLAATPAVLPW